MDEPPFLPIHCRAARGLLGLSQEELGKLATCGRMTVKKFEASESIRDGNKRLIRESLEKLGIVFINEGDASGLPIAVGVGLTKKGLRQLNSPRS